jgi:hypothetical protein
MNHFGCNHFASNHFASNHFVGIVGVEEVVEEAAPTRPAGGSWEQILPFRPHIIRKFEDEEERKAAEIIEEVLEVHHDGTQDDVELILRMRLDYQHLLYKEKYLTWLFYEHKRIKKAKKQRRDKAILLLLH